MSEAPLPRMVGASTPRVEGEAKVTGRGGYTADLSLPGMLWGKVLRSPHPHARIVRIDTERARRMPGVHAVVTAEDTQHRLMGKVVLDMPVLCWDTVRFVGDRVAAVAAETPELAEAAVAAIDVEYEPLPAVFDPLLAMEPNAPLIHQDPAGYLGAPRERLAPGIRNGQARIAWMKGDALAAFARADFVLEHTFRIPSRHQGYLEPHAALVAIDGERVSVWASTKAPFRTRLQVARAAGIDEGHICVYPTLVGGDFGGKGDAIDASLAYYLALTSGRPVRVAMTSTEELSACNPTHPTVITIRSGVSWDGEIQARSIRMALACGAYAGLEPNACISAWHWVGGAYRVPNTDVEIIQVYTNTVPGGYFRAPGAHQFTFALESHTDLLAGALGMDRAEFRRRNLLVNGEVDAIGQHLTQIRGREVLEAALAAIDWTAPKSGVSRGRGIAVYGQQVGGGPANAVMELGADGSIEVLVPTPDQGSGTPTILQQLIADELGIPAASIHVRVGDTDSVPFDDGARASRVTYTQGNAVLAACRDLRERLAESAAALLDCTESELTFADGVFSVDGRRASLTDVAGKGAPVRIVTELELPQPHDVVYSCAQIAEVDVDRETGQVDVVRLVSAHDVGLIINPIAHQGQIDGGVITGLGLALMEELVEEDGRIINANLGEYKLPSIADLPPLETILVSSDGGTGPHGAKAIGEFANNGLPGAIANAVADAIGAPLFELPITAERVLRARLAPHSTDPQEARK